MAKTKIVKAGNALAKASQDVLLIVDGHLGRIYCGNLRKAINDWNKAIASQVKVVKK